MKYKFIAYIAALLAFTSCNDFLDREPKTTLSPASFWKTEIDLRLALNTLYQNMNRSYSLDNQSIDCFASTGNSVSAGTLSPGNTDDVWKTAYKEIRVANNFMENYQHANVSEAIKNRYAGEARFFRAYFYFNLIKRFGDVPYVLNTLDLSSPELMGKRESKKTILDGIIDDLEFAEQYIPLKSKMKSDVGRVTKGAVQAFLARVTLYYGTYYKFHGGVDYKVYLQKAKEVSRRLIDSKEYSLYKNYRDLFLMPGEDSDEHILSYRYSEEANSYNPRIRATIIDFAHEPTRHLADAFLCKDGLPIGKSIYKVDYLPMGKEFENRDPRMALTVWKPGDSFRGAPFVPNLSNQTRTGYMFKKYGDEDAFTSMNSSIDEILIRYAEALITFAEATYELDEKISDAELDLSVNVLRKRFDGNPNELPRLTNAFVAQYGLDMREELRRERRVELCGESLRYDDLIRWKTAETELNQAIIGAKFDANVYTDMKPGKDINLNTEGFILVQNAASRSFDVAKNYLFPLPLREISLNPNLTQNSQWE